MVHKRVIFDQATTRGHYSQEFLDKRRAIKTELIWRQRAIAIITLMVLVIAAIILNSMR